MSEGWLMRLLAGAVVVCRREEGRKRTRSEGEDGGVRMK